MAVNFYELIGAGGLPSGREAFERMIVQLVRTKHPVMGVAANPGDWGIDAYSGDLDGVISVWQAKFFIEGFAKAEQQQVRDSFRSALSAAEEHGHRVTTWTLCVPVEPDAPTAKWWSGWKSRMGRETGVTLDLWSQSTLEPMLLSPDAQHVLDAYFPASSAAHAHSPVELRALPRTTTYDRALFVRQLEEAGIAEHASAKRAFFNFDLLARAVADKAVPEEERTLETIQAEAHALWEARFGGSTFDAESGICPELHSSVLGAIETLHHASAQTRPRMSVVHRFGGMHHLVESGDAGWVRHFRRIVEEHGV